MSFTPQSIIDAALSQYEIWVTDRIDDVVAQTCMEIRHEVFCQELGFEPCRDNGKESDDFDHNAWHLLLIDKRTKSPCGTARFVLGDILPAEQFISPQRSRSPSLVSNPDTWRDLASGVKKRDQERPYVCACLGGTFCWAYLLE